MAKEIVMPRLSDTMEEGKILKWHKQVGDEVHKGDVLAEIETDKANMELESYDDGVLLNIMVSEGGQAPLGVPIAMIGSAGEAAPAAAPATPAAESPAASAAEAAAAPAEAPSEPAPPPTQSANGSVQLNVSAPEAPAGSADATPAVEGAADASAASAQDPVAQTSQQAPPRTPPTAVAAPEADGDGERLRASPIARRIAEERGIDLRTVTGTGPGGRIVRDDVENYQPPAAAPVEVAAPVEQPIAVQPSAPTEHEQPAAPAAPAQAAPASQVSTPQQISRMQQTIARRMSESKQQVPHFYVTTEVDTNELTDLRKRMNAAGEEPKLSYNDFIVKAAALALVDMPLLNSSWKDNGIVTHSHVNIGVAVSVPNGLIVPVVHDAGNRSLRQIATITRGIIERTRDNKLKGEDVSGATFTISNLGMYDVDEFMAIVDLPTAAILAVGSIRQKPVVMDGAIVIRERMRITISADHRVIYGAEAAQFLQLVKRRLESPYSLLG